MTPMLSVLMTAYNREQYLVEAIKSVLASTFTDFELIIVDDASTDGSFAIASQYAQIDNRIRVYRNETNLKDYPNRNRAASYATGKYLKYLDSDDTIYPDGLQYCVDAMEQFPEAAMGMIFFQKEYSRELPVSWAAAKAINHHFFVRGFLNIGPSGCIFRTDLFKDLNGFDSRFGVASDNFFNIKLAAKYPVVLLPREFFFYRVHDGQEIQNKLGYLKFNHLYMEELLKTVPLPISNEELTSLKKRAKKRLPRELVRYCLKYKNPLAIRKVMKEMRYSFSDFIKGLFAS